MIKGINKIFIILGIIVALLIGLFIFVSVEATSEEEVEASEINSAIYSLLVAEGIDEALVDATDERVIVSYDLPEGKDKEASWHYVLGAVAAASPDSKEVFVQAFVDDKATEELHVQMSDLKDFLDEKLSEEELKGKLGIV